MTLRRFFRVHALGAFCLAPASLVVDVGIHAVADTTPKKTARKVTAPSPKQANSEAVRANLFIYLEKKAGRPIALPDYPREKLLVWVDGRHNAVAADEPARYRLLGEHLRIAQKLMGDVQIITRKRGYWIASESANFAGAKLSNDKKVLADIYEGFLLPQLSLANTQLWEDPSRSRVLENAVSVFGNAGERDKQVRVLEWIISLGNNKPSPPKKPDQGKPLIVETNTLDWARGTLASLLFAIPEAKEPDVKRALTLLKAIQSPNMTGFKHLQEQVQARLDQLKTQPQPVVGH